MVPQEGGHGAFIAEFGYFARADAALRADDQQNFTGSRASSRLPSLKDRAQRPYGVFVQDDGKVRRFHGS